MNSRLTIKTFIRDCRNYCIKFIYTYHQRKITNETFVVRGNLGRKRQNTAYVCSSAYHLTPDLSGAVRCPCTNGLIIHLALRVSCALTRPGSTFRQPACFAVFLVFTHLKASVGPAYST